MSTSLFRGDGITLAHGNSNQDKQISIAAEAIWGIRSNLPPEKYAELKSILDQSLVKDYGPYHVQGIGNTFVIGADEKVLDPSYKSRPCTLGSCMVTDAAFRCGKCQQAMYCSKDHQTRDWSRHKLECLTKES